MLAEEVVREVAQGFKLDEASLQIHQTMPKDFLLLLPDERTADQVFDGGWPFHRP